MIYSKRCRCGSIGFTSSVPNFYIKSVAGSNQIQIENAKPIRRLDAEQNRSHHERAGELWRSSRSRAIVPRRRAAGETLKVMVSRTGVGVRSGDLSYRLLRRGGKQRSSRYSGEINLTRDRRKPSAPECKWEPSIEFEIPKDWLRVLYLGNLRPKKGIPELRHFHRTRRPPGDLLFCSDMTGKATTVGDQRVVALPHRRGALH